MEEIGIYSKSYDLPAEISQIELLELIDKLNHDDTIDGILVQLPLPQHIDTTAVLRNFNWYDVDGFHPYNVGRLCHHSNIVSLYTLW